MVAVTFARPASGRSSRKATSGARPGPPTATGTGARVCEVSMAGLPSLPMTGALVFFWRCTISSALPWSAVTRKTPPTSSTQANSRPRHSSHVSQATTVASMSPV
eukprot:scaffold8109_cov110-Isochrysis_galbana.AAC.1